jgi:exopolyphosphatase/guanosine-5'-triphosphate,3'-diphosphate pyrophosphatase
MNLRPDRADVILPAANVLKVVANVARVNEIEIPNVGLKNGILLDIANEMVREQQLPRRDQVWDSALRMGKKYQFDFNHASFVSNFATKLFDQTTELHSLGGEERLLLEIAALLHDIGHFITTIDHDKHGYYLLKANHILGLSERQQEIVACLVKYHRKGTLFQGDLNDQMLSQNDRSKVTILCALLRLADALDSSHTQNVEDIILSQNSSGWKIRLIGKEDLSLEKWAVMKRRTLFQEVFGFSLDVE